MMRIRKVVTARSATAAFQHEARRFARNALLDREEALRTKGASQEEIDADLTEIRKEWDSDVRGAVESFERQLAGQPPLS